MTEINNQVAVGIQSIDQDLTINLPYDCHRNIIQCQLASPLNISFGLSEKWLDECCDKIFCRRRFWVQYGKQGAYTALSYISPPAFFSNYCFLSNYRFSAPSFFQQP